MNYPNEQDCLKMLEEQDVHPNVIQHSKRVAKVALGLSDALIKKGISIDRDLVLAAALLHDIKKLKSEPHAIDGAKHLKELGHDKIADVVLRHGLYKMELYPPTSLEDKIVFYADKRVNPDGIVSIDDRFEYLKKKYKSESDTREKEYLFVKKIEDELFKLIGGSPVDFVFSD